MSTLTQAHSLPGCRTPLLGLIGLAVVIAAVVGVWRWSHRDDDVVWVEDDSGCGDGYEYVEVWEEEWYEEER